MYALGKAIWGKEETCGELLPPNDVKQASTLALRPLLVSSDEPIYIMKKFLFLEHFVSAFVGFYFLSRIDTL
jgi:hypothetical protein